MAEVYDVGQTKFYDNGTDDIIIRNALGYITGGCVLDLSEFTEEFVKAGHVIITDGENHYKPCGVSDGKFESIGESCKYAGINVHTIEVANPEVAGVLTIGEVNEAALPYDIMDIKEDFQAHVKIDFAQDY